MVTKAEWAERVKRWAESGLGREEFAEGEGLNAKRLTWWRWKLRTEAEPAPKREPVRFLPVRVVGEARVTTAVAESPVEVVLGNGRTVRVVSGFDAVTLARVLRVATEGEDSC
jgi:hypothetical protein